MRLPQPCDDLKPEKFNRFDHFSEVTFWVSVHTHAGRSTPTKTSTSVCDGGTHRAIGAAHDRPPPHTSWIWSVGRRYEDEDEACSVRARFSLRIELELFFLKKKKSVGGKPGVLSGVTRCTVFTVEVSCGSSGCSRLFSVDWDCYGSSKKFGLFGTFKLSWLYSVVFGCVWLCLVVFGCVWLCLVVFGCVWLCLVVSGCVWLCLVVSGCVWWLQF